MLDILQRDYIRRWRVLAMLDNIKRQLHNNNIDKIVDGYIKFATEINEDEWENKMINDIKVGDEVIVQVDKIGFVTGFDVLFDRVYVTTKDGWSDAFGRLFVKKTGRHFDEIENVLKQMRKGDKDDK